MRIRLSFILITGLSLFFCLVVLTILAFHAQKDKNLFFVLPTDISSPRFNLEKIEDFSENEFLLTYEIIGSERLSLSHAEFPVTLFATNSNYAQILGLRMLEGSFFTKQAWVGRQRQAVLNEKAAQTIFGSNNITGSRFRIRNEIWVVIGLVSDGDEDRSRLYIPSSIRGGEATALALTSAGTFDEAYVINSIKNLGIRDGDFSFINFDTQSRLLWERIVFILLLFFIFLLFSLIKPLFLKLKEAWGTLKTQLNKEYARDILLRNRKNILKLIFFAGVILLFPALSLFFILQLVSICLPWQDIPSLAGLNFDYFYPHLYRIRNLDLISNIFFGIALISIILFFIIINFCLSAKIVKKDLSKF